MIARLLLVLSLGLAGCAQPPMHIWGERHDNPLHHAQRLAALDALLARGERPALLMEHLDHERQPRLDAARAAGGDAQALIAAAGGKHWPWAQLSPFIERALTHGLPLVAVNLSREQARRLMREGLAAHGYEKAPALQAAQAHIIQRSHCDALPPDMAPRMAQAQLARDQQMARSLQAQAGRGAVLLTGNGHARRDLGVPQWLSAPLRDRVQVSLWVEPDERWPEAAYDHLHRTEAAERADPCAALQPSAPASPR
ncbi:MAG: ChaN family lipoprotein [Burkholderiales bacterium]|nr:ChaN family lipoprotein [Burkholderiales bacterium]